MTASLIILVLLVAGTTAVAIYWYRRSIERTEGPDQYMYIEGLKALLRGQDELAFAKLKETVTVDSGNVDAYIQLGNIFRRRKKYEQALQVHRDLTQRGSLNTSEKREILLALYRDFMALEDEQAAMKAITEILVVAPQDRFTNETLLRWHEKSGAWKEAAQIRRNLDKLDGVDSKKTLALYKVFEGHDLAEQGDRHRARLFYKEAIHIDKYCLAAYIAIGDSYYDEKRLEDALGYWTKVIAFRPADGQVVFERLKKGFFEVGRYGDYADTLSTLLQSHPEHLTARLELAYFMEKKGEKDAAREHYTVALDNHPDSMLARLGLFRLNLDTGKKESAEATYKQIMKLAVKKEAGNFGCRECSLLSRHKVWLCPRCKAVDSFDAVTS